MIQGKKAFKESQGTVRKSEWEEALSLLSVIMQS